MLAKFLSMVRASGPGATCFIATVSAYAWQKEDFLWLPYDFRNEKPRWEVRMKNKIFSRGIFALAVFLLFSTVSPSPSSAADGYLYSTTPSPYVEGTDEAANIFDPLDVSNIQLDVDESIVDYFRYCCNWEYEGPWKEAQLTMTVKGETIGPLDVGFHLKGAWGSWRDINSKPGIKIKVDAFVEGQTIFGVKKLILNNMAQDGSALNQQLTFRLFRAMNVPASRTGYTHLQINDSNYGLYTIVESLDRISLARWFETTEHLYKGGVPYHWADLVPDYEYVFQVETGSLTNRSDLMPLLMANVAEDWWTEINKVADMQEMVREWAVEQTVGHWDGYSYNGNNYFIHADENGIFSMMPWGVDNTWGSTIDYNWTNKTMSQRCLQTPQCYSLYVQAVADATYAIKTLDLEGMASEIADRINEELKDDVEPYYRHWWFFAENLSTVEWYQSSTQWMLNTNYDWAMNAYVDRGLANIQLFDSALRTLSVNGMSLKIPVAENDLSTVYLASGTDSVSISASSRQNQADVEISGNNNLVSGANTITIEVTSVNGESVQEYQVPVYVYSKATKNLKITYSNSTKKITEASFIRLHNTGVIAGIKALGDVKVVVTGQSKAASPMLKKVVKILKGAGLTTPESSTFKVDSKMAKGSMKVAISYLK